MTSHKHELLSALNLEAFTLEEQEEMLLTLSDLVFRGTIIRLIEAMDDKTRTDFMALCDADASGEEVQAFLEARVPGADDAVRETVAEIAHDMAALDIPAPA